MIILLLLGSSVQASSHTTPVRVVIERVQALSGGIDTLGPPDFYPSVYIDGQFFGGTVMEWSEDDDISPEWKFTGLVPLANSPISITIRIWDADTGFQDYDDEIDLTPGGDRKIDLTVDLDPCALSGDVTSNCWTTIQLDGTDSDNARIWFRIEVGDPPAMAITTVTIERVISQDSGIDPDPASGEADFYPVVRIAGTEFHGDNESLAKVIANDDDISPTDWQFTKEVPFSVGAISVDIEIWDDDDFFTFNDDHVDVSPLPDDRTLNLTVTLDPCSISGNVSGNCGVTIVTAGDQDDDAEIWFRIEVDPPPTIAGFNIRCLHQPLWPQVGETITITAEVLDDTLNPIPFTTGVTIEIWVDDQVAPDSADTNVSSHSFTVTPAPAATKVVYGCTARTSFFVVWSEWHGVQIGPPATRAVPVLNVAWASSAIDIVFVPDVDNYTGAADPSFINSVGNAIRNSFYGDLFFLQNQRTFNFWLAQDTGDYEELCEHTAPSNWDSDYAFAEAGTIVHTDILRDCASPGQRLFSGTVGMGRVFLHEAGHQPFGLADEYCCDAGYFQADPYPNVYEWVATCGVDAVNVGRTINDCRTWTADDGEDWSTSDPPDDDNTSALDDDLMADNGPPQALDRRRIEWMLNSCNSGNC